jgi:predicted nucleic acid-binding Zn ribbon protein
MPIYEYETIPGKKGQTTRRFEVQQGMMDAPLKKDPETGERVRRVISGGLEIPRGSSNPEEPSGPRSHSCGGGCSCH